MCLLIRNPLVDGAGDAMIGAVRDFLVIGHLLNTTNMSEWVEVIATEADSERASDGHVRLGHLGDISGDEEGKKSY